MVGRVQVERMGGAWGPNLWSSPQGPEPDRRVGGAWQDGGRRGEGRGWGCGRGRRRRDPRERLGWGGAETTHCGHQVLQSPAEPHRAAEAQLQVLQGAVGSWSLGQVLPRGPRPLGSFPRTRSFCPPSRGRLRSPHSGAHRLVLKYLSTRAVPAPVPRRPAPSGAHSPPTPTSPKVGNQPSGRRCSESTCPLIHGVPVTNCSPTVYRLRF